MTLNLGIPPLIQLDRRRVEAFYLCTTKVEVAGTETEFAPVSV